MTALAIDTAVVAIAKVAEKPGKYTSRPVLTSVSITNGEAVASDGVMLLVCPLPKANESDATVLLDAKELVAATKSLKGECAGIVSNGTYATVTTHKTQTQVSQIDGTFPDMNQIFDTAAKCLPPAHVCLDARKLKTMCEAFIAASGNDQVPVHFYVRGLEKQAPVTMACQIGTGIEARTMEGILMPILVGPEGTDQPMTRAERTEGSS